MLLTGGLTDGARGFAVFKEQYAMAKARKIPTPTQIKRDMRGLGLPNSIQY